MSILDPRSIVVALTVSTAVMALVLDYIRRHYPLRVSGHGSWAAAGALFTIGAFLFSGRDLWLPNSIALMPPNILLIGGAILYYVGCRKYYELPVRWRSWLILLILFTFGMAWWTYVTPSYVIRTILFTGTQIVIYSVNLLMLLQREGRRLPVRLVEAFMVLLIAVALMRMITISARSAGGLIFEPTLMQTVYAGAQSVSHFVFIFGAVLMATDRLVMDLNNLAQHDYLTQLLNRRALFGRMESEIARAKRSGSGPALMILDLDHFKTINDTKGHQFGDKVLIHFAKNLQGHLRETDYVGRYGGEEFMAMLPDTDQATATHVAQRIHGLTNDAHPLACQVSIGLSVWAGPGDSLEALIARADSAVYKAKEQGRNRICIA